MHVNYRIDWSKRSINFLDVTVSITEDVKEIDLYAKSFFSFFDFKGNLSFENARYSELPFKEIYDVLPGNYSLDFTQISVSVNIYIVKIVFVCLQI